MKSFLLCLLLFSVAAVSAQKNNGINFGDITLKDFEPKNYRIDTAAYAVVLYNAGSAEFDADLNVVYKFHRRVRLLHRNAFHLATVEIPMYKGERSSDRLNSFRAVTYNSDGRAVQTTTLDKESIFDDKVTRNILVRKFTFPDLKEGCIIEYNFEIRSPSNALRSWRFQENYPVLTSKYEVTVPDLTNFVFLKSGPFDLQPEIERDTRLYRGGYNSATTHSTWELHDLPAVVKENYVTTIQNYISRIEFQLKSIDLPHGQINPITVNWGQFSDLLMKSLYFGKDLSENNGWLSEDLKPLLAANDKLTSARNIFNYVRNTFTCNDHSATELSDLLKQVYKSKKGNVADINIVLVAMLKKAGIDAAPVLLSTREHGLPYDLYPIRSKFNYVIADADIDGRRYLLDASHKKNGFNHLPANCYNGYAHKINDASDFVAIIPDSVLEKKSTSIYITNSSDGKKLEGSFTADLGYFESAEIRDKVETESADTYFKTLRKAFTNEIVIMNTGIDSLRNYDEAITVHYDFDIKLSDDIIYFNPLLSEGYKENPFKSAKRTYPVEMPSRRDETVVLNMAIPVGYKVDELPKSEKLNLNDTECMFEYIAAADDKMIQLRSRLRVNRINYGPEDYESIRQFYEQVVKKQSEQIVFKKK